MSNGFATALAIPQPPHLLATLVPIPVHFPSAAANITWRRFSTTTHLPTGFPTVGTKTNTSYQRKYTTAHFARFAQFATQIEHTLEIWYHADTSRYVRDKGTK